MQTREIKIKGHPVDWQKRFQSLEDFTEFLLDHNYELIGLTKAHMRRVKILSKQKKEGINYDKRKQKK